VRKAAPSATTRPSNTAVFASPSSLRRAKGCRAPSRRARLALLLLSVAALFAIPAAQASADLIVNLAGPGAGSAESDMTGSGGAKIECSNTGGPAGPNCAESFPTFTPSFEPNPVELSATPGPGFVFEGWTGEDPLGFFVEPHSCNASPESSCLAFDPEDVAEAFGVSPDTHITATFGCAPPVLAPDATTGEASAGQDPLSRTLAGTVNPNGCGLEESYFEYGTTTEYGSTTASEPEPAGIGRGSAPVPVTGETDFLQAEAVYHYRLVAVGPGGMSKGEDQTLTTGSGPGEGCPNASFRAEQGTAVQHLPDCMALEMTSPPNKQGYRVQEPNVSADGSRVSFYGTAALGQDPPGLPAVGATYVASRGESVWATESTIPSTSPRFRQPWEITSIKRPSFAPDFSRWFGIGAGEAQAQLGVMAAYEAGIGGFFRPLSAPLVPFSGEGDLYTVAGTEFIGASANRSHLYFSPGERSGGYFAGDPRPSPDRDQNVYLARVAGSGRVLELLSRDLTGKVWGGDCGARLGGDGPLGGSKTAKNGDRNQGAVSADGSRTYFSARAGQPKGQGCDEEAHKLRILERVETSSGPQISPLIVSECGRPSLPDPPGPCKELGGDDLYQGASLDQSKVYFTTSRQLASTDVDGSNAECSTQTAVPGCDLYLYDRARPAGHRLVQVSAGEDIAGQHESGNEADVYNGITAISADGSHVYYVATGVLSADPNPAGDTAQANKPNLYLWDAETEQTSFLGTLASALGSSEGGDQIDELGIGLWGGGVTWRNNAYPVPILSPDEESGPRGEEGGDGHVLVFESMAELTANDADGRHRDVYRYDADAQTLECISCMAGSSASKPDEARFDVETRGDGTRLGTDFAETGRWVSEDGQEIGFMTPQRLLPGDVNRADDGYLWRQGSLARLPGKPVADSPRSDGPFLSHDGSTVAFATQTQLLPQDRDGSADVYVARIDGGFPPPPPPQRCQGEECRGEPTAAPQLSGAGTAVLQGAGNLKPKPPCRKGRVLRHGKCVKKHRHQGHHKHRQDRAAGQAGRALR
jgi:hypothetical protein